jgi:outer membrane protein assembly factor BamB
MTTRVRWLLMIALTLLGCSSGGGPSCSLENGSVLAATTWPKFRADTANTGRAPVDISTNSGVLTVLLPQASPTASSAGAPTPTATPPGSGPTVTPTGTPITRIGPVETTPIVGPEGIFIASADGNVYVLNFEGQPVALPTPINVDGAITGSPLLGFRQVDEESTQFTLFVPSNGLLSQFDVSDGLERSVAGVPGFVAASPNIWNGDGTAFTGSLGGVIEGVCPNGVARYVIAFPATQSAVAVVQDPTTSEVTPIIVAGGLNGQVRAYNIRSRQKWSFFASADITAAIMVDETTNQFYVADENGRVFTALLSNGQFPPPPPSPTPAFSFTASAGIAASLALGRDEPVLAYPPRLYIADMGGTLYARDRATGQGGWNFSARDCVQAGDPCPLNDGDTEDFSTMILSSPAVATGGAVEDIIVFGVDVRDGASGQAVCGYVCAVVDEGAQGSILWSVPTAAPIGASSPSIGPDGTIYIGSQGGAAGGAVYAIGP